MESSARVQLSCLLTESPCRGEHALSVSCFKGKSDIRNTRLAPARMKSSLDDRMHDAHINPGLQPSFAVTLHIVLGLRKGSPSWKPDAWAQKSP